MILLLIAIISGFVWMNSREGSRTRAANFLTSLSACDSSLIGYAWTENVGWISMNGTGYSVKIDSSTGLFSGFAWSENIGWVDFAPTGGFPATPLNAPEMNLANGDIAGWASILVDKNDPTNPTGWVKMNGVKVDLSTGKLSGFAWSEDYGWIDFGGVTWGCTGGGGTSTVLYNDGILVYTSALNAESGSAAVDAGGTITYSLEITNQGSAPKEGVNLHFTIPLGYVFLGGTVDCSQMVTCGARSPMGDINGTGTNQITWTGVTVPAGESKISFSLRAP